jgi:HK97 family phage major capsid protein
MAAELDSACLMGTGVGQPKGIYRNDDICEYSLSADGRTLAGYDDILYGIKEIITVNGPVPNTAIMSPRTLIGYSLLKSGDGKPLERPDLIKNITFFDTSKMPVTEEQGSSGAVCSSIILGGFESLVIGIRSVMEIQVLNERFADYGQVGFLATMRADSAVYQPKAFCKIIGIKA